MKTRIAALAVLALLAAAAPASAATITVTGTGDVGTPTCTTSCPTLRAALAAAGRLPGPDTIVVPAGTTALTQGPLNVNSPVTIRGAGARLTAIIASPQDRVFDVGSTASPSIITGLTLSRGSVVGQIGGNLVNSATLLLDHVRVTGGTGAGGGGGIGNAANGRLTVQYSLIDGNSGGEGGGIENVGPNGQVTVRDSTITGNSAGGSAAGVLQLAGSGNVTTLERVTVVLNSGTGQPGGIGSDGGTFRVRASILDRNEGDGVPTNCGDGITSFGANISSDSTCTFTAPGDLVGTNPQLGALSADGQTNVFALAATSPARDRAGACLGTDQRGVLRPQAGVCDSGAYEFDTAPQTTLSVTPGPTFTFSSSEPGVRFQCKLDNAPFAPCTSPTTYPDLAPGSYTFFVRAVDARGTPDPTPSSAAFTIEPPEPTFHQTVVVREVSGRIRIRLPGTNRFVSLDEITDIPLGSTIDARKGVVLLSSQPRRGRKPQSARFYDGLFRVTQPGTITDLKLVERLAKCKRASAAARRKRKRRLWGNGRGRFRTSGQYSSATVRGTKWLVQDSCAGTLTRVVRGKVSVRDKVRRKTIRLGKGKRYLARPKR